MTCMFVMIHAPYQNAYSRSSHVEVWPNDMYVSETTRLRAFASTADLFLLLQRGIWQRRGVLELRRGAGTCVPPVAECMGRL